MVTADELRKKPQLYYDDVAVGQAMRQVGLQKEKRDLARRAQLAEKLAVLAVQIAGIPTMLIIATLEAESRKGFLADMFPKPLKIEVSALGVGEIRSKVQGLRKELDSLKAELKTEPKFYYFYGI